MQFYVNTALLNVNKHVCRQNRQLRKDQLGQRRISGHPFYFRRGLDVYAFDIV